MPEMELEASANAIANRKKKNKKKPKSYGQSFAKVPKCFLSKVRAGSHPPYGCSPGNSIYKRGDQRQQSPPAQEQTPRHDRATWLHWLERMKFWIHTEFSGPELSRIQLALGSCELKVVHFKHLKASEKVRSYL